VLVVARLVGERHVDETARGCEEAENEQRETHDGRVPLQGRSPPDPSPFAFRRADVSNTQVASPNATGAPMIRLLSLALPVLVLATACPECGGEPPGTADSGPGGDDAGVVDDDAGQTAQLTALEISPDDAEGFVGETVAFTAQATWDDGVQRNVSGEGAWALAGDTDAFEEKAAGVWLVLGAGTATVTVAFDGFEATATLRGRARDVGVVALSVEPPDVFAPVGVSVPVRAFALYGDGQAQDVTTLAAWEALTPAVATIDSSEPGAPLITGVSVGFATVRVSFGGQTLDVDVEVTASVLEDIEIVPANAAVPVGATLDLVAIGRFADGELFNVTDTVSWSSADEGVVTVDAGTLTGVSTGSVDVTASDADTGVSAQVTVEVTPAQILSLGLTPAVVVVPAGAFVGVRATAVLTDEAVFDVTSEAEWALADPGVALLEPGPGPMRVLGVVPASTTLTATYAGRTASALVTVTDAALESVELVPGDTSLPVGVEQQFFFVGTYGDGSRTNLGPDATWTSSDPDVALVSQQPPGRVTALAPGGPVNITASSGGFSESVEVTVTDAALVSLQLSPPVQTVPIDEGAQFNAIGVYSDNSQRVVNFEATWASEDEGIATISNAIGAKGFATGVAAGETTVSATVGAFSDTATIRVTDAQVAEIFVTPPFLVLSPGFFERAQAIATYTNGTSLFVTDQAVWGTGDDTVAQASNAQGERGRVTGIGGGMTQVEATFGGVTGSSPVFVSVQGFDQLFIVPRNEPFLAPGLTVQLGLIGVYAQNNDVQENLTGWAVWSSADESIATVDNFPVGPGRVTGHAPGIVTISATYQGQTVTKEIVVEDVTVTSLELSPPDPVLPVDAVQALVALATLSDGSLQDVTGNTEFSSDDNATATMLDFFPGVVLALAPGATTVNASLTGVSTTTSVTVIDAAPTQVVISPINPIVNAFQQQQFTAIAVYDDGSDGDISYLCSWSSDDTDVLLVFDEPIAKGFGFPLQTGTATVTADCNGLTDSTLVTVR
jgi:hypothetical protein